MLEWWQVSAGRCGEPRKASEAADLVVRTITASQPRYRRTWMCLKWVEDVEEWFGVEGIGVLIVGRGLVVTMVLLGQQPYDEAVKG